MAYSIENALFQWEEGERRVRELGAQRGVAPVVSELRRRLGSRFTLQELCDLYAGGVDWALSIAQPIGGAGASWVVDAAFARYAREATDYAGGRLHAS